MQSRFAAIPESWSTQETSSWIASNGPFDGVIVGLTSSARERWGNPVLPFIWVEEGAGAEEVTVSEPIYEEIV